MSFDTCDESKCVSKGNSLAYNGSFTCYGDGMFYLKMCADGYLPVDVTTEAPITVPDPMFGQATLQYFTCCPPSHDAVTQAEPSLVTRHCSDPMSDPMEMGEAAICQDHNSSQQPYARPMETDFYKKFTPYGGVIVQKDDSFLCCDQDYNNSTTVDNYLDQIECLPYANDVYEPAVFISIIGIIDVVVCDIPGFEVPRPYFGADADFAGPVYQCCKSGTPLNPFVHDRAFKITVYTEMVIASIAAFLSLIAGVAMLIPLFKQLKSDQDKRRSTMAVVATASNVDLNTSKSERVRSSLLASSISAISSRLSVRTRKSSVMLDNFRGSIRGRAGPKYSTYNIYLVYLVLADFLYFVIYVALFGTNLNQKFYPQFFASLLLPVNQRDYSFDNRISYPYVASNLWINAIICYQLLVLLKSSQRAQRIQQPSAKTVNLQIWTVYFFVTICGVVLNRLFNAMNANTGNLQKQETLYVVANCFLGLMAAPPFLYAIYVAFIIWWRGYIPSLKGATPRAKAMRQLAFYFFRIIAVFLGVWFPVYACLVLALTQQKYYLFAVAYWLTAAQPIFTFLVILTKSDTRTYVWDLVTFKYVMDYCKNKRSKEDLDDSNKIAVGGVGSKDNSRKKDLEDGEDTKGTASGFTASVHTNSLLSKSGVEDSFGTVLKEQESNDPDDDDDDDQEELLEDDSEDIIASVLGFSAHFNMRDVVKDAAGERTDS